MKIKAKRLTALLLAALLALSVAATPVYAAGTPADSGTPAETAALEEENEIVSIRMKANGEMVYGSPFTLEVETRPEGVQYIGVVMGTSGEASGYVTLIFSDKIRTLLKLIPLPRKMSVTPDQEEEFNVYSYLKQLIDGHDVSVLLRVADEAVSVMDVLKFYVPTLKDISTGMKLALELIRKYLPENAFSRIYLDEQPTEAGRYVAGAIALESGDMNTAGIAFFTVKPKSEGVRLYWASDAPETLTPTEAASFNTAAVLESDGQVVPDGKITCTYRKSDGGILTDLFGKKYDTLPTEPGDYLETATVSGNYSCSKITRVIHVAEAAS